MSKKVKDFKKLVVLQIIKEKREIIKITCMCSNANPLHYYALRVPRKTDRWR